VTKTKNLDKLLEMNLEKLRNSRKVKIPAGDPVPTIYGRTLHEPLGPYKDGQDLKNLLSRATPEQLIEIVGQSLIQRCDLDRATLEKIARPIQDEIWRLT
jgi:hypothetical protein